jgi:hypothetical protein
MEAALRGTLPPQQQQQQQQQMQMDGKTLQS